MLMALHIYKKLNDAPVFEIGPSGRFQLTTLGLYRLAATDTQKQVDKIDSQLFEHNHEYFTACRPTCR